MAAPTEPALDLTPGAPSSLAIKRATLMQAAQGPQDEDEAPSRRVRNIESYVGFIVDGRYHIESVIAQGGMGVVYFARHRLIDKPVALKILRPELVHNREITARFLTEAQAASAIGSEHIVDVTDYGELPDGATYIVMEYLDGLSLNQRIRRAGGLLPLPTVLAIAREIAEGLQRAHDANIVHRDLKPDNVLLVTKGKQEDFVKILDFGIAKVQSSQNQTTTAGKIFGTPHYMSPEQGRGDELDHRTDIYSLGVILYEMITGHVPFDGENPLGILTQHMYVEVKSLSSQCKPERVTPALECVVARCLMKDPNHRYASMAELDEDLRRLEAVEVPLAWEYFKSAEKVPEYLTPLLNLPRRGGRSRRVPAALLLAAGVTVAVLSLQALAPRPTPPTPEPEPTVAVTTETAVPEAPPRTVMLAADPLDAHVFRGNEDLGQIPLLIQLRPGQVERLTVRRTGYKPHELVLDGSKTRFAIPLEKLPGPTTLGGPAQTQPAPVPPSPEAARVVDLRERTEPSVLPSESPDWSPDIERVFGDDVEAPDVPDGVLTTQGASAVILPPQYMDPSFAPEPPGPPASVEPAGPKPLPDVVEPTAQPSPSGVGHERPASSAHAPAPPPGPPPVEQ